MKHLSIKNWAIKAMLASMLVCGTAVYAAEDTKSSESEVSPQVAAAKARYEAEQARVKKLQDAVDAAEFDKKTQDLLDTERKLMEKLNTSQMNQNDQWRGQPSPFSQQPGFQQPGFMQPGFPQPGVMQPGFQQPGFPHRGFPQPGFQQGGFAQPGFGQGPVAMRMVGYPGY